MIFRYVQGIGVADSFLFVKYNIPRCRRYRVLFRRVQCEWHCRASELLDRRGNRDLQRIPR